MSKKALVVDNDFFFVEFLAELLEARGYEVAKAYDGKEGISRLEVESFDLLFVDIIMPKIDGKELIRFARMEFPDANFHIIAVSGAILEQLNEIDEIGADYYIAKGPMEQMANQFNAFMDKVENQALPFPSDEKFVRPENLFARTATVELIETVDFHRAITESVGIGIIVIDTDTKIISINSFGLEILQKPFEKLLNRPITTAFPEKIKAQLIEALKGVLQMKETRKITFFAPIHSKKIRIIVSVLNVKCEIAGWVIAMEETGQWVEQA
ncbi:MAG: response regulator [Desulfobacterales bacterium]|nr:response regulator [Pseudomonadota bacterium]MCG2777427.1 response regulator [Desulfobacterales bacterium]